MAKAIGTSWTTLKTYDWVPGTGFRVSFYLEARYSSSEKNNIEGNYSNIYTRLRSVVHAGQGSGYGYKFTCSYAPTVSGSSQWFLGTEVITESGITRITHEDDGTKTITLTASGSISPIGLNFSISEDVVLDTIPRASTLLDQSGTIGQNLTINWTPASDKFTHKLTYSFGSIKDEVLGTNLKKSFTWSIPTKLYKEFTGQSAKGTLKLTTYNGTTQIGSTQEVELIIYANQSFSEPVIDGASLKDINSTTIALTGDDGTFILGQSKLFLTLTFKTRNFATLKSLSINGTTIANNKVTAGKQSTDGTTVYGLEYEYGTLNTQQLLFRVTDTRNYTVELKSVISDSIVIKYIPLTAVTTFKRITPTGGKVGLVFNGNYFNGSFGASSNTLEISYKYKKSTDSAYTTINLVNNTDYKISGNTYYSGTGSSKQTITLAPTFDYKTQYDVQVVIKDKLTTLPIINAIISKGIPIMWWNGEKVVVNGDLQIATSDGATQTTIIDGTINTNGNLTVGGTTTLKGETTIQGISIFNREIIPKQGQRVHSCVGTHGSSGYVLLCQLTIKGAYQNEELYMDIVQRNARGRLRIRFESNNSLDPALNYFLKSDTIDAYLVKNTTSVWNLYVRKTEGYDVVDVVGLYRGSYTSISIDWKNSQVSSLPSGYTTAKHEKVYSTGEKVIGTWIDGKPIYQKVVTVSLPSTAQSWVTVKSGVISNLSSLISIRGWFKQDNEYFMVPMGEGQYFVAFKVQSNGDILCNRNGWSAVTTYLTLEYTKTTD